MFNFFKNKSEADIERKRGAEIAELQEKYPVGTYIRYLGRQMIVSSHYTIQLGYYSLIKTPKLVANYSDDHGVIRGFTFSVEESRTLNLK